MDTVGRQTHWDKVYSTKGENEVSWFENSPEISLELIGNTKAGNDAAIIDIGGGASRLADVLLSAGFRNITVLDLSEAAFETARRRIGPDASRVKWIVADVTRWEPEAVYDVWHDRAAFHFLTDPADRAAYAERLQRALKPGGEAIMGTFAPDGPERCSGLPVTRHDAKSLGEALGPSFELVETRDHLHRTPAGGEQKFQFSRFRRV